MEIFGAFVLLIFFLFFVAIVGSIVIYAVKFLIDLLLCPFRFISSLFREDEPQTRYVPNSLPESYSPSPPPEKESAYTSDWGSVSKRYKEKRGWSCQHCYVYCGGAKAYRRLLHVHHINLDSKNNAEWNLIALCVDCHSKMPGAGHKRLAGAIRKDGRLNSVLYLRASQGR